MTPDFVLVLTTLGAGADAAAFARVLVEERLAACVNLLPEMRSIYRWQGRVHDEPERQVLIKTSAARLDALRRRIGELHSYDVPELIVLRIADGGEAYLRWVAESVERG
jgi:periplasmic divalent cation tolerance protein